MDTKPQAYHIKDWNVWYESAETRKLKTLTYYGKSNKLVGEGIGHTLAQDDNIALLGTWALIEAIASTAERDLRGWLIRNGRPMNATRMAALLGNRVTTEQFQRALDHFASPEVGWLERVDMPGETPDLPPQKPATLPPTARTGTTPGNSPATLPPTATGEREVGREQEGKGENREVESDGLPWASHLPSLEEVKTFALASDIPIDFVLAKLRAADERKDFAKSGWTNGWQDKLRRFWKVDGLTWGKSEKKPRAASGRPDGWKEGDRDRWWTDSIADVRAERAGAVAKGDQKNAARLLEIIESRGRK